MTTLYQYDTIQGVGVTIIKEIMNTKLKDSNDYLLLKWGTLKGWCFENSPEALEALEEYCEIGSSASAMLQKDTPRQKELICLMIDKVNGPVSSDWTGEDWTSDRDVAKKYVMEYGIKTTQ